MKVRFFEKTDLEPAVALERLSNQTLDPDFDVPLWPSWAWDEEDFRSAIRQYKSSCKATKDTRIFAVETETDWVGPKGKRLKLPGDLVGCFIVEYHDNSYEILLISALDDEVRATILAHILKKSEVAAKRLLTMVVADGDDKTLRFLVKNGFKPKLLANPATTGHDSWHCERILPVKSRAVTTTAE